MVQLLVKFLGCLLYPSQLQRVDYPAYSEELFYDRAGNRARRLVGGEEELYQYDLRNRLMALTRGGVTTPFQYDLSLIHISPDFSKNCVRSSAKVV